MKKNTSQTSYTMNPLLNLIGAASSLGGRDSGAQAGPEHLQRSTLFSELLAQYSIPVEWKAMVAPVVDAGNKLAIISEWNTRLANAVYASVKVSHPFCVFGGDHSCAIGTWSGAAVALGKDQPLGLLWIDAHMDAHTFETSPSNNIHGMPVASLLGYGAPELCHILAERAKIKPEHIILVGIRSYELGEAELLHRLGVRIYFMKEVQERGVDVVLSEVFTKFKQQKLVYGISIDIDGLDPVDAPAVSTREPDGIRGSALLAALKPFKQDPDCVGIEFAEFNPSLDQEQKTEKIIADVLNVWRGQ